MLTMTFIQMLVRDTYNTRDILFRAYTLYTVIVTVLSLFMAFFPGQGSKQLDATAISKYCQELSETNLFYFDSVDDCLTKSSLNLRRNELIFINISFIVQMHFIHVIWSHLQNSSLPRSQGGCVPDLRTQNIQMQHVALSAIQDEYMPTSRGGQTVQHAVDTLDTEEDEDIGENETIVDLQ